MTTTPRRSNKAYARPANGRHALVITVDHVEPAFYTGWRGSLDAPKTDRASMAALLGAADFAITELTNEEATRDDLFDWLAELSDAAVPGDLAVVYFSGHGATLPDLNNDELGVLRDGAWCLYDGMFVDDELTEALTKFKEGVRVLLMSDSCFTGTIVKDDLLGAQLQGLPPAIDEGGSKLAPVDIGERVYEAQQDFYDAILMRPPADPDDAKAAVLVMSACRKGELARVAEDGGSLFTGHFVRVWNDGLFSGTYAELFDEVSRAVTRDVPLQHPVKRLAGKQPSPTLEDERAFGPYPETPPWNVAVPGSSARDGGNLNSDTGRSTELRY